MGATARTLSWLALATLATAAVACGNERQAGARADATEPVGAAGRAVTMTVPTGTTFTIRTQTALSTERNRPGDVLTAGLTGPLVDGAGTIIIPGNAIVRARVTAVATPAQIDQPAVLHLAFEAISFTGHSYPIQATIEQVIGRTGIAVRPGAAVGQAAGTPIAIETENADAILPRGTDLLIRVNEPVTIGRRAPGAR